MILETMNLGPIWEIVACAVVFASFCCNFGQNQTKETQPEVRDEIDPASKYNYDVFYLLLYN